jgi:hypothetical protein
MPWLPARPTAQGIGSGIDRRQTDHFGGQPGVALDEFSRLASLRHQFGNQMHRHTRTTEYRIATQDFRVGDDQTAGTAQIAQRGRKRTPGLPQIDLDQAALKRHDIARGLGQGVEDLAPEFGSGDARRKRRSIESDMSARASSRRPPSSPGTAETVFLSIALFTALSESPVKTAASVGVNRVSCVC